MFHRLSSRPRGIKPQLPIANLLINTPDTGFPPSFVSHLSQCIYSFIELILDSINAHECPLWAVHFWTLDLSPRQLSLKLCLNLRPPSTIAEEFSWAGDAPVEFNPICSSVCSVTRIWVLEVESCCLMIDLVPTWSFACLWTHILLIVEVWRLPSNIIRLKGRTQDSGTWLKDTSFNQSPSWSIFCLKINPWTWNHIPTLNI